MRLVLGCCGRGGEATSTAPGRSQLLQENPAGEPSRRTQPHTAGARKVSKKRGDSKSRSLEQKRRQQRRVVHHMKLAAIRCRFPGMQNAAGKASLARAIGWVESLAPGSTPFSPQTWILPDEIGILNQALELECDSQWFIVKPDAGSKGRGISLAQGQSEVVKAWQSVDGLGHPSLRDSTSTHPGPPAVVQRYVDRPFLWDNCKFDLRLYVLLTAVQPEVVAFLAPVALARRCKHAYAPPTADNSRNAQMHLSNTSLNADAADSQDHCRRTLTQTWRHLEDSGIDTARLWTTIRDGLISRTLACMQPGLALQYEQQYPRRTAQSSCLQRGNNGSDRCFQVLGFDVMIDADGAPHLIELNHNPSFKVPTQLDFAIKGSVLRSALQQAGRKTPMEYHLSAEKAPALTSDSGDDREPFCISEFKWEPVKQPEAGDDVLLLRELRAAFDFLRREDKMQPRTAKASPPALSRWGRERLYETLSALNRDEAAGGVRLESPQRQIDWDLFATLIVQVVTNLAGHSCKGERRAWLDQILGQLMLEREQ